MGVFLLAISKRYLYLCDSPAHTNHSIQQILIAYKSILTERNFPESETIKICSHEKKSLRKKKKTALIFS